MEIKIQKREQKLLIRVGIVAFVAVILPNIIDGYALNYMYKQTQVKTRLERSVQSLDDKLSGIEGERKILRRFVDEYRGLVNRNVINNPSLVDLVKKMKEVSLSRNFFPPSYEFLDNQQFPPEESIYTKDSSVNVNVLPMRIEMNMLHDLDIFMFVESLNENVEHVSYPISCQLQRVEENFILEKRENMRANCTIAWYWVNDPDRGTNVEGVVDSETAAVSQ